MIGAHGSRPGKGVRAGSPSLEDSIEAEHLSPLERGRAMMALMEDEKIGNINPDLQGLLEARSVDKAVQAGLHDLGVTSVAT